jgi:chorismate mutase
MMDKKEVDFIGGQGPLTEKEQRTISANIRLHKQHMQMLDGLSAEAEANGLTPDILADLLRDND